MLNWNTISSQYHAFRAFLRSSAGAGVLLFAAALLAILAENSFLASSYKELLDLPLGFTIGTLYHEEELSHWVNDGLMAIFFLLVGLEIKREMLTGELSSWRLALLPTFAAAGGMLFPALIFAAFNYSDPESLRGWAVPVATDIAFSLGVLAVLGSRVPLQVKVFLTAVAVMDDLGAIAIIAIYYSDNIKLALLGICLLIVVLMLILNLVIGVTNLLPYLLLGFFLWVFMLESGLHATLAGVLTALCIPHGKISAVSKENSALMRLEYSLHNSVAYVILPLFAFTNAGVNLSGSEIIDVFTHPLPLGIALGLFIGKPVGIFLFVFIVVRIGLCALPRNTDFLLIFGVALLCGIGFTVSLFIGNLAFYSGSAASETLNLVKVGVLSGTLLSAVAGYMVIRYSLQKRERAESDLQAEHSSLSDRKVA